MKTYKLLFFITALLFLSTPAVLAVECSRFGTPSEELKRATSVFSGKVTETQRRKITDRFDEDFGGERLYVKLKVDKWWKGNGNNEVILRTSTVYFPNGTSKQFGEDFFFNTYQDYLVYAFYYKGALRTSECTRTRELSKAGDDLKELGAGFLPENAAYQKQELNVGQIPVGDYNAVLPINPHERLIREKRNKLRNLPIEQNGSPIDPKRFMITEQRESSYGGFPTHSSPEPAIPAASSTTILVGEITSSQAFLSEDKVSIYSEFDINISEILKNESKESLKVGNKITVSRGGGAVRMPSGKIIQNLFGGKPMPYIDGKYVFFLKYNAETEEYPLITAYEIRNGRIIPLDGIYINWEPVYELASHRTYKGLSETEFISQVQKAIKARADLFELKK
ncbi:MAG TPA: hypothetical protein VF644_15310 [Pyrinomonadaceae bacterium]|jgi:hypothetical protein